MPHEIKLTAISIMGGTYNRREFYWVYDPVGRKTDYLPILFHAPKTMPHWNWN